ncbi:hypothetical protein ACHAXS_011766 [Conticribra weissflogii]
MTAISATIALAATLILPNVSASESGQHDRHRAFARRRKLANAPIPHNAQTSLPRLRPFKRQRHRRNEILTQQQQQPHQEERRDAKKKSNDVGQIAIPLCPFTIRIVNVSSPGIAGLEPDAILNIINETTDLGTQILAESEFYGERFLDLDLGEVWAVDFSQNENGSSIDGVENDTLENDTAKMSKTNHDGDEDEARRDGQGYDENSDEVLRHIRSLRDSPLDSGTALITLGQNGTVYFKGSYFLEDPLTDEVTLTLVKGLSEMDRRNELAKIVNGALKQESSPNMNVSALSVEVVSLQDLGSENDAEELGKNNSQDDGGLGDIVEESEPGEQDPLVKSETGEENDSEESETGENYFVVEEKIEAVESQAGVEEGGDVTKEESGGQREEGNQDENEDNASSDSVEEIYTPDRIESSPEESSESGGKQSGRNVKIVVPVVLGIVAIAFILIGISYRKRRRKETIADQSYRKDHVNADRVHEDLPDNDHEEPPTLNVPVTANDHQERTPATKNIDKLLADFSDGDSSFVSEPSEATNSVFSGFSGLSGLSSFLGESNHDAAILSGRNSGAFALEDVAHLSSRLSHYSDTTALSEDNNKGVNRTSEGRGGTYLPSNLRKPESFEGHKATSAMAQFSLRKDFLQVIDGSDIHEGSIRNKGTSRTMSPKKTGLMMDKQRMKDKKKYENSRGNIREAIDDDENSLDEHRLTRVPTSSIFDALEPHSRTSKDDRDDIQSLESSENIASNVIPLHRNGSAMT